MQCANRNTVCIEKDERFTLPLLCYTVNLSERETLTCSVKPLMTRN